MTRSVTVGKFVVGVFVAGVLASPASLRADSYGGDWPLPYQNTSLTRVLDSGGELDTPSLLWKRRLGGVNAPLLVQDVTGDGKTDVVTLVGGRALCRSPETGTLLWASPALQLGFFLSDTNGRAPDLDGDGRPDIVVSKESVGDTRLYVLDGVSGKVVWTFGEGLGPNSGVNGQNVAWFGNIDSDPQPEMLLYVPSNTNGAIVYAFDFSGALATPTLAWQSEPLGYVGKNVFSVFDASGDGTPELLMSSGEALYVVRLSDGGTIGATTSKWYGPNAPTIPYGATLTPIQADGDMAMEFVLSYGGVGQPGMYGVYELSEDGTPLQLWRRDVTTRWIGGPPADLDGDGKAEVIASVYDGGWTTRVYSGAGVERAALPGWVYAAWTVDLGKNGTREPLMQLAPDETVPTLGTLQVMALGTSGLTPVFAGGVANAAVAAVAERAPGTEDIIVYYDADSDGRADALQVIRVVGSSPLVTGNYLFPKDLTVTYRGVYPAVVGSEVGQMVVFTSDGYFDVISRPLTRVGQRIPTGGFAPPILAGALSPTGPREAFVKDSAGRTLRVQLATGTPATPPDASTLFVTTSGRTVMGLIDLEADGGPRELIVFERVNGIDRYLCLESDAKTIRWSYTTDGLVGPAETGTFGSGGDVDGDGHLDVHLFTVIGNDRIGFTLSGANGQRFPWSYTPYQLTAGLGTAYSPAIVFDLDGDGSADVLQSRYGDRPNGAASAQTESPLAIRVLRGTSGETLGTNNITADPGRLVLTELDGDPATREIVVGSWKQLGVVTATKTGLATRWALPSGGPITRGMPMVLDVDGDGANDIVHFDHTIGRVRARRGVDGAALWPAGDGNVDGDVVLGRGRAFRVKADGTGYVDIASGEVVTVSPGVSLAEAAVAVTDLTGTGHPTVVFGGGDGVVYGVNAATGGLDFSYDLGFTVGSVVPTDLDGDGLTELLVTAGDGYLYALAPAADLGVPGVVRDGVGDDVDLVSSYSDGIGPDRFSANWDAPTGGSDALAGYFVRLLTDTGAVVLDWQDVGNVDHVTIASGVRLVSGVEYAVLVLPYSKNGTGAAMRSDGFRFVDADQDGVLDPDEATLGSDPNARDSDGDRIDDGVETAFGQAIDTDEDGVIDALDDDSDGDGLPDLAEGATDTDGDTTPDYRDTDDDNDTIPTAAEHLDAAAFGANPDGDDLPNWRDEDSDNDDRSDADEGRADLDADGVPDYLDYDDGTRPDDDTGTVADVWPTGYIDVVSSGGNASSTDSGCTEGGGRTSSVGLLLVLALALSLSIRLPRR